VSLFKFFNLTKTESVILEILTMKMKPKEILYRSLYYALMEIRFEAYEAQNKSVFALSNLLNNIPLKLLKADTEEDYAKILQELELDVENNKGLKAFLTQIKEKDSFLE
jgi:hypothetical protein